MEKKNVITNEIDGLTSYATDVELEKVLEFIDTQFKSSDSSHGQYENCVRLSNFIKNNNIIIGELEAERLLEDSPKLMEMYKALSLDSVLTRISTLSNLSVLLPLLNSI